MRFKSKSVDGFQVFAVSGINTVSFGITATAAARKGLLGFSVERVDPKENQRFFMRGFKVFRDFVPKPDVKMNRSTFEHPVQSLVWDDFTGKPGRDYEYIFHPVRGAPKNLDRSAEPVSLKIRTEPDFGDSEHDVFFNRGVASSQAYADKFHNLPPDQIEDEKLRQEAYDWLSRSLNEAIDRFIAQARKGDTLLCCFYEFRYAPVAEALAKAAKAGVTIRLIVDAKRNGKLNKKTGKVDPDFPRVDNLKLLKDSGLDKADGVSVVRREARADAIQHNKFMVLLKGKKEAPTEVWTGSTNISEGGIFGQTNVGHWVRDAGAAALFAQYWTVLSEDPGGKKGDDAAKVRKKNAAFREAVEAILDVPTDWKKIPKGVTPVFSPRSGSAVLDMYGAMVDDAARLSCITLAFGINQTFKALLEDNTAQSHVGFFLLEKEDVPNPNSKKPFVDIGVRQNIYKAWGSFLKEPLHQWAKETSAGRLGLNHHVAFIHSKFLLMDPLGDDPIVVTGSANFSDASTNDNDENMLLIRGNERAADIYFTEFNRLFFHYYFRSIREVLDRDGRGEEDDRLFLDATDVWLKVYKPGSLRSKRVQVFADMANAQTLK
jgi:phosphatidylserine/phosphatidylglycerophosphate/cardiolipin synthase-like enzyme